MKITKQNKLDGLQCVWWHTAI